MDFLLGIAIGLAVLAGVLLFKYEHKHPRRRNITGRGGDFPD